MNILTGTGIAILVVFGAAAAIVAESLRSFSRSRLDNACRRLGRPERFAIILRRATEAWLATRLLTALIVLALAALAGVRFAADLGEAPNVHGWAAVLIEPILLLAFFIAMFVLLPWSVAHVTGERLVARLWPLLDGLSQLLRPYIVLAQQLDLFMHRLWGIKEPSANNLESLMAEIKSVVELGYREGILASQARRIIERVIALQEEDVGAVMTPRTNMDCIPVDANLEQARRMMLEGGHSRMPVIGSSTDDIIGILYAKDLLRHLATDDADNRTTLRDIVREPFYVPETTGIDRLLESMKRRHVHIAIVLDEYSGVAGLVTMEDVLEQIVGEIVDEYDTAEDTGIRQVGPGIIEVAPRVRIDDLDEQFGFDFPEDEDYDTIGGFIYAQLGRVPKKRETVHWNQLRLTVLDVDKRRIHRIRVDSLANAAKSAEQRPSAAERP